jgi:hypothetical protein
LADLSRTLAELEFRRDRIDAAIVHIDRSLALFGYPVESTTPDYPAALTLASRIHVKRGDQAKARLLAAAALRISESVARQPGESADVGEALLAAASASDASEEPSHTRDYVRRAVQALTHSLGEHHSLTREALELQRRID